VSELTGDLKEERLTRKRVAAEEGAKALEEVAKKAVDVRANMARLRALRGCTRAVSRAPAPQCWGFSLPLVRRLPRAANL
jgi:hypothetical protein